MKSAHARRDLASSVAASHRGAAILAAVRAAGDVVFAAGFGVIAVAVFSLAVSVPARVRRRSQWSRTDLSLDPRKGYLVGESYRMWLALSMRWRVMLAVGAMLIVCSLLLRLVT